jgi:hypothetical protein
MPVNLAKNLNRHGVLVAIETGTYGSGAPAPSTTTDGILAYATPEVATEYTDSGAREGNVGGGSSALSYVAASGRKRSFSLEHYFTGPGAAYSASVRSSIDRMLRLAGFSATVGGGAGTERIDYAPIAEAFSFGVFTVYARQQTYDLNGAFVNKVTISSVGLPAPKWTFDVIGRAGSPPADASVPAITNYGGSTSLKSPKATAIGFAITAGGQTYQPVLREWTLTFEREVAERISENEAGGNHAGVYPGQYTIRLEALVEATAVVTGAPHVSTTAFDPYRLYEAASGMALAWTVGATQYNRFGFAAPNAQFTAAPREEREGPVALWGLDMMLHATTDGGTDPLTISTT